MLKSVLSVRSSQSENFALGNVHSAPGDKEGKTRGCQLFCVVDAEAGDLNRVVRGDRKAIERQLRTDQTSHSIQDFT